VVQRGHSRANNKHGADDAVKNSNQYLVDCDRPVTLASGYIVKDPVILLVNDI
jgi:hypothetical protein